MITNAVISSSSYHLKKIITDNSPKKIGNKKMPQLELAVPTFEG